MQARGRRTARHAVVWTLACLMAGCTPADPVAAPSSELGAAAMPPPATAPPATATAAAAAAVPMGFPPQPDGVPWPTDGWQLGAWPAGVDHAAVAEAAQVAFAGGGPRRVRAVVVVHGGRIVFERSSPSPRDEADTVYPSHSIAKSFASAALGVLVREGLVDVAAPAPIDAWRNDERAAITIEHLLHMSSGLEWVDGQGAGSDFVRMLNAEDMAAFAAAPPLEFEPGTTFEYSSGTTVLLARVMAELVEGDFRAFLDTELFTPLGMAGVETAFDRSGTWIGAFGVDTTARNFAKFAYLYLRGGVWDGQRILDPEWLAYTRTPATTNPEYGAHWWLDPLRPGVLYAVGIEGQALTVDPEHDLVIAQFATDSGASLLLTEAILDAFRHDDLAPPEV